MFVLFELLPATAISKGVRMFELGVTGREESWNPERKYTATAMFKGVVIGRLISTAFEGPIDPSCLVSFL